MGWHRDISWEVENLFGLHSSFDPYWESCERVREYNNAQAAEQYRFDSHWMNLCARLRRRSDADWAEHVRARRRRRYRVRATQDPMWLETVRAKARAYHYANREKRNAASKAYREQHKDDPERKAYFRLKSKEYRARHKNDPAYIARRAEERRRSRERANARAVEV